MDNEEAVVRNVREGLGDFVAALVGDALSQDGFELSVAA